MSDSSIRVKPSIEEPSNWISPSRAFSNCDRGTSTFLMIPRMSVNWSLRNRTFSALQTFRISDLERPGPEASNLSTLAFAILTSVFCKCDRILESRSRKSIFFCRSDVEIVHSCTRFCARPPGGYDFDDGSRRALAHPRRGARAALRVHAVRPPAQARARGRG